MAIPINEQMLDPAEREVLAGLVEHGPSYPWLDDREVAEKDRYGLVLIRIGLVGLRGSEGNVEPYMIEDLDPEDDHTKTEFASTMTSGYFERSRLFWKEGALDPSNSDALKTGLEALITISQARSNLEAALGVARTGKKLDDALSRVRLSDESEISPEQLAQAGIDLGVLGQALSEGNIRSLESAERRLVNLGVNSIEIRTLGVNPIPGMALDLATRHRKILAGDEYITTSPVVGAS